MLVSVFLKLLLYTIVAADEEIRTDEYCMKSAYHKEKPGPEESLFGECAHWKNNSCCNWNTTVDANKLKLYNFDYDHCLGHGKPALSESCRKYFILDLCFIECSPDMGFWVVKDDHSIRKERVKRVPLCASECDAWFEACKDDFTCTSNWAHSFDWSGGTNECLLGTNCRTISQKFETSKHFCETIWDGSWEYTDNNMPCMSLTFDENELNPNIHVAQFYSQTKCSARREEVPYLLQIILFLTVSLFRIAYTYT